MGTANSLENFYDELVKFLVLSKQQIVALGHEHGLTAMQALTLVVMDNDSPRPMRSLGATFGCDASNVTGLVDGLEHRGLMVRQEKPGDRRVKMVSLLPKGAQIREAIIQSLCDKNSYILSKLNAAELAQLVSLMHKIGEGHSL